MDLTTKINIMSGIIIPLFSVIGGVIGFFVGMYKQRNDILWKEDREAMQCAYSCCQELRRSVSKNITMNLELVRDLSSNKWFNIKNKKIREKVYYIMEYEIVDRETLLYINDNKEKLIGLIDELLPLIMKELNK